jgi:hypothetical protein
MEKLRNLAPFGINFVVNAHTFPDLNAAIELAADVGASEFLLLPEQPSRARPGIDSSTTTALREWVHFYGGCVPLTISEAGCDGLPTCNPLAGELGLRGYAHIDAAGVLKSSSYARDGVPIEGSGVMAALELLRKQLGEDGQ